MDNENLNNAADEIVKHLPNHGFILLAIPYEGDPENRLIYVSSLHREDAIKVMKEFLIRCGHEDSWMKHIE